MPDRIQQEIEELLARLEQFPPRRPLWQRLTNPVVRAFGGLRQAVGSIHLPRISAGHLLLLAITVIVVGYLAIETKDIARWVIAGGIVLFIVAFVLSLRRSAGGGRPPEKYWRDRPLDLRSRPQGDSTRSWWDRWRGRR